MLPSRAPPRLRPPPPPLSSTCLPPAAIGCSLAPSNSPPTPRHPRPAQKMAAKATPCKEALAKWAAGPGGGAPLDALERVELCGLCPPIEKMDSSLVALKRCRHLALSTNNLDKIGNLAGLESLESLSLGRNCLKKLENLEAVAATLQQLWVSYNQIDRLVGGRGKGGLVVGWCSLVGLPLLRCSTRGCCSHHLTACYAASDRLPLLNPPPTLPAGGHRKMHPAARAVRLQQPHQGLGGGGAAGGAAAAGGPAAHRQPAVLRVAGQQRAAAVPRGGGRNLGWQLGQWEQISGAWASAAAGMQRGHNGNLAMYQVLYHAHSLLPQVLKRVPTLKKLDGQPVDVEEREAARK